jgi:hypothetical protein
MSLYITGFIYLTVYFLYLKKKTNMKLNTLIILFASLLLAGVQALSQESISILEAREVDAEGSLVRLGERVELCGVAIGPNFRPNGHTWVLFDRTDNIGITVFAFNMDMVAYDVVSGDEMCIVGELDEFNGLAEIVPESITIDIGSSPGIPDPEVVTELNEQTEAKLIIIENVSLVDPQQWGSSNFNVEITDGTNTFQMRIDGDIDIAGMAAPLGTFNVTGIGSQFDGQAPYFEGYQILPRSAMDIDPYDTGGSTGIEYRAVSLEEVREIDLNGEAVLLDENVEIRGITHGINFRPSGLQFTLLNENNIGVGIFSSSNAFDYEFVEGDELLIKGKVDQFNGLTQINPDSLVILSQNNDLVSAQQVADLNESTESSLVTVQMSGWVNELDWRGDGSSFNIDFMTANGQVLTMRIDSDTELADSPIPDGFSFVTGFGGQFDNSVPYDEGYQLFPRFLDDFDPYLSVEDRLVSEIKIYPNPADNIIFLDSKVKLDKIQLFNMTGQLLLDAKQNSRKIDISIIDSGVYIIKLWSESKSQTQKLIVNH